MTGHPPREQPDRPLEGLGTFAWKLSLASVVAVTGVAVFLVVRGDRSERPPGGVAPSGTPAAATSSGVSGGAAASVPPGRAAASLPVDLPAGLAESSVGRDVDRRHAAGELSEARRTFEPCRGGDLWRIAWIDAQQRVRKLAQVRGTGMVVEQWFDEEGRLREALVRTTAGGRPLGRRITVDERGRQSAADSPPGAVADDPPPSLVHGDPSSAFFAGPGCNG